MNFKKTNLKKSAPDISSDTPDVSGMRLNKAIAASGFCSRRTADALIFAGRVSVNHQPETNPARQVLSCDTLAVDGLPLAKPQQFVYILLNKPPQVVCTMCDPEGRETVLDYLPPSDTRLYPVGRLDYFSEGLLLLTNDGTLAQYLMHPRYHQTKTYEVAVRETVTEAMITAMRNGMRLQEGEMLLPVDVTVVKITPYATLLRMGLRQGINRQIRRICRELGLTILRLRRTTQGTLALGALRTGKARPLTADEIAALKKDMPR